MTAQREEEKFDSILDKLLLGKHVSTADLQFFADVARHKASAFDKPEMMLRLTAIKLRELATEATETVRRRHQSDREKVNIATLASKI